MGDPAGLVERVEHDLPELADVDDARDPLPQRLHRLHELEALREEEGEDALLHLRLERLEQNQDHEGGDERVEEEQTGALSARPAHEEAVDGGEHEAHAGEHDDVLGTEHIDKVIVVVVLLSLAPIAIHALQERRAKVSADR